MRFKVNNASSTAKDTGDDAFAGNLRWPLQTNSTGLDTFDARMHSFDVLGSQQMNSMSGYNLTSCCMVVSLHYAGYGVVTSDQ
ncbi:hypothetical protein ABBQ38_006675 [Trebouxia sp. C0009 RCD-2024]